MYSSGNCCTTHHLLYIIIREAEILLWNLKTNGNIYQSQNEHILRGKPVRQCIMFIHKTAHAQIFESSEWHEPKKLYGGGGYSPKIRDGYVRPHWPPFSNLPLLNDPHFIFHILLSPNDPHFQNALSLTDSILRNKRLSLNDPLFKEINARTE